MADTIEQRDISMSRNWEGMQSSMKLGLGDAGLMDGLFASKGDADANLEFRLPEQKERRDLGFGDDFDASEEIRPRQEAPVMRAVVKPKVQEVEAKEEPEVLEAVVSEDAVEEVSEAAVSEEVEVVDEAQEDEFALEENAEGEDSEADFVFEQGASIAMLGREQQGDSLKEAAKPQEQVLVDRSSLLRASAVSSAKNAQMPKQHVRALVKEYKPAISVEKQVDAAPKALISEEGLAPQEAMIQEVSLSDEPVSRELPREELLAQSGLVKEDLSLPNTSKKQESVRIQSKSVDANDLKMKPVLRQQSVPTAQVQAAKLAEGEPKEAKVGNEVLVDEADFFEEAKGEDWMAKMQQAPKSVKADADVKLPVAVKEGGQAEFVLESRLEASAKPEKIVQQQVDFSHPKQPVKGGVQAMAQGVDLGRGTESKGSGEIRVNSTDLGGDSRFSGNANSQTGGQGSSTGSGSSQQRGQQDAPQRSQVSEVKSSQSSEQANAQGGVQRSNSSEVAKSFVQQMNSGTSQNAQVSVVNAVWSQIQKHLERNSRSWVRVKLDGLGDTKKDGGVEMALRVFSNTIEVKFAGEDDDLRKRLQDGWHELMANAHEKQYQLSALQFG